MSSACSWVECVTNSSRDWRKAERTSSKTKWFVILEWRHPKDSNETAYCWLCSIHVFTMILHWTIRKLARHAYRWLELDEIRCRRQRHLRHSSFSTQLPWLPNKCSTLSFDSLSCILYRNSMWGGFKTRINMGRRIHWWCENCCTVGKRRNQALPGIRASNAKGREYHTKFIHANNGASKERRNTRDGIGLCYSRIYFIFSNPTRTPTRWQPKFLVSRRRGCRRSSRDKDCIHGPGLDSSYKLGYDNERISRRSRCSQKRRRAQKWPS